MKYTSATVIAVLMNVMSIEDANASVIQQKMENLLEQQGYLQDAL